MMISLPAGVCLTCWTSVIKSRQVPFDLQEVTNNMDIGNVLISSTSDNTINITGQVVKSDNVSQQKVKKCFRTAVIGDQTGAVLVMLWEEIAQNVSEGS